MSNSLNTFHKLQASLNQTVLGQERLIERLLIAMLADGHLLVEGAPGLAKTRAIKALGEKIDGDFHRIQFTPDLLPADVTGTEIYRPQEGSFHFQAGPVFHNLVLADEINRAPAKVQSALLEAMGERQVTVGAETYPLPDLFLVMATQNPIEQEGTYPLPEAQLDRFLLHVLIDYPSVENELEIMRLVRQEALSEIQNQTGNKSAISGTSLENSASQKISTVDIFAARNEVLMAQLLLKCHRCPYMVHICTI